MAFVNLQQWIQHPELLDRNSLYELRLLINRYPYFQSLRLLYLQNLYLLHDVTLGSELQKSALFVADRRKLFQQIEGGNYILSSQKSGTGRALVSADEPSVDRTMALISAFLSEQPEEVTLQTELDYVTDYTDFLFTKEDPATVEEEKEEEVPQLRGQTLIDLFLEKSDDLPQLSSEPLSAASPAVSDGNEPAKVNSSSTEDSEEGTLLVDEEDDSCFTETLAKIYIKQQRYAKALEIIKKLSLKYPKKNAYFADQIRFLEKLIINAKSK